MKGTRTPHPGVTKRDRGTPSSQTTPYPKWASGARLHLPTYCIPPQCTKPAAVAILCSCFGDKAILNRSAKTWRPTRLCFYQTRSAWSMDQGSNRKHSAVHNFAPTVTKFCVMWEGQALPHDTKFSNCRCEIVGMRVIFIWSLIPGSSWSGLIKAEPDLSGGHHP